MRGCSRLPYVSKYFIPIVPLTCVLEMRAFRVIIAPMARLVLPNIPENISEIDVSDEMRDPSPGVRGLRHLRLGALDARRLARAAPHHVPDGSAGAASSKYVEAQRVVGEVMGGCCTRTATARFTRPLVPGSAQFASPGDGHHGNFVADDGPASARMAPSPQTWWAWTTRSIPQPTTKAHAARRPAGRIPAAWSTRSARRRICPAIIFFLRRSYAIHLLDNPSVHALHSGPTYLRAASSSDSKVIKKLLRSRQCS